MEPGSTRAGGSATTARPAPRRGAWPLGVVGMLAIVAAVESYVAGRHEDLGTTYSIEWRRAGQAIGREAKGARVLCFGTSLTRMGVAPKVLEERLGMPAYNFATSGGQPYSAYTSLRQALAAGSKPEALVVDFTWSALATPYDWNERVLPELASLGECAELAVAARDPSFLARIALVWGMPTFRCRAQIRSNIVAAVRGEEPNRIPERHIMARNANINRGGNHAMPTGRVAGVNLNDPTIFPTAWECVPLSEYYIHKFLDLAESHGIPVFWLVPPVSPPVQGHRDELALEGRYTRFIEGVAARHRGVVVVDGRGSRYGSEAFFDMIHLNRDGAVAFTDELAEVIKARLERDKVEGSGWVHLPEYCPDPLASRVEDLGHSAGLVESLKSGGLLR